MKSSILKILTIAFLAEMMTSLWIWQRQPSHGLVDYYNYSFWNYLYERIVPWFFSIIVLLVVYFFLNRRTK